MGVNTESARRIIAVEHLARVEGHGGITGELDGDRLERVHFDVFEGIRLIEGLIGGRRWEDVSQIVSRICAICSVAHALTSIRVTEKVFGVETSARTELLRDLQWRGENIESHALHLFLLAAPDYLGYPSAPAMAAEHPEAVALGLRLKQLGNQLQLGVGGRAIHPVNAIPGGFGRVPSERELVDLRNRLEAAWVDVDAALELVGGLPETRPLGHGTDFVALRMDLGWRYDQGDTIVLVRDGERTEVDTEGFLDLFTERGVPHSHAKHSTIDGRPFMVGALARITANADRLPEQGRELVDALEIAVPSTDPLDNNKAQAVELAMDVQRGLALVEQLLDLGPVPEPPVQVTPRAGRAVVITEAPRGILLHQYGYSEDGRITAANVITPTAFNAASLERHFQAAVQRDGVEDEAALKHTLEMIARAYDPCISCSVHLTRRR